MRSRDHKRESLAGESEFLSLEAKKLRSELADFHWAVNQLHQLDRVPDSYDGKKSLQETLLAMVRTKESHVSQLGTSVDSLEKPNPIESEDIKCDEHLMASSKPDCTGCSTPINVIEVMIWFLSTMSGFRVRLARDLLIGLSKRFPSAFIYHVHNPGTQLMPKRGIVSLLTSHESPNEENGHVQK